MCDDTDSVDVSSAIVDLMSYIKWCDVLKSRCDVICSAYDVTQKVGVMSFKSGCDISGEGVMTKIQWVSCLIQGV